MRDGGRRRGRRPARRVAGDDGWRSTAVAGAREVGGGARMHLQRHVAGRTRQIARLSDATRGGVVQRGTGQKTRGAWVRAVQPKTESAAVSFQSA